MRGRVNAIRTFKGLVADLRFYKNFSRFKSGFLNVYYLHLGRSSNLNCFHLPVSYTHLLAIASVKVLHGCRQIVPRGVGFSAITSATLVVSY